MKKSLKIVLLIFLFLFVTLSFIYCYIIINFTIYGEIKVNEVFFNLLKNIDGISKYITLY